MSNETQPIRPHTLGERFNNAAINAARQLNPSFNRQYLERQRMLNQPERAKLNREVTEATTGIYDVFNTAFSAGLGPKGELISKTEVNPKPEAGQASRTWTVTERASENIVAVMAEYKDHPDRITARVNLYDDKNHTYIINTTYADGRRDITLRQNGTDEDAIVRTVGDLTPNTQILEDVNEATLNFARATRMPKKDLVIVRNYWANRTGILVDQSPERHPAHQPITYDAVNQAFSEAATRNHGEVKVDTQTRSNGSIATRITGKGWEAMRILAPETDTPEVITIIKGLDKDAKYFSVTTKRNGDQLQRTFAVSADFSTTIFDPLSGRTRHQHGINTARQVLGSMNDAEVILTK